LGEIFMTISHLWKDELEKLVAQSTAMARAAREKPITADAAPIFKTAEDLLRAPPSDPARRDFAPVVWPPYGRDEINRRVASFQAHQQKMAQDRETFFLQTMARALAPLKT
jgi:hypothetical protein